MANASFHQTMDRLMLLIQAGYPVIYIVSYEEARVLNCLARILNRIRVKNPNKHLWRWYEGVGLEYLKNPLPPVIDDDQKQWLDVPGLPSDPDWKVFPQDRSAESSLALIGKDILVMDELPDAIFVYFDLHQYLRADLGGGVRPLRNAAAKLRDYYDAMRGQDPHPYKTIIVIAPTEIGLSPELERDMIVVHFPLPETGELRGTLKGMLDRKDLKFPTPVPAADIDTVFSNAAVIPDDQKQSTYETRLSELIAGAGRGLTLEDYKLGLNMFAVESPFLHPRHIEDMLHLKAKSIQKNEALHYTPHVTIELGGLEHVKAWTRLRKDPMISSDIRKKYRLPPPKGVMLCGVSGGGKSQLAKLMAKELGLALLRLDVGALFGQYVGDSEKRTREALQLAEALAPVVLWLDEIDKAFSGMAGGGDNGVSSRVFGYFLTWLSEKQDDIFVVTTANDFEKVLTPFPEFGRKGRFDEIFWIDLPTQEARHKIFDIYLSPHLKDYLTITEADIESFGPGIARHLEGDTPVEKFLSLLSQDTTSGHLTGAEIEHAINEALYEAYKLDRSGATSARGSFTAGLINKVVKDAKERALYAVNSSDYARLQTLREAVKAKNWIEVK